MIEIIALIFLSKKMGELAERKGLKKGMWKFYTILTWFLAEFAGALITVVIFRTDDVLSMMPLAYGCAIGSYFLLKSYLAKKPDIDERFEFEQNPH